MKQQVIISHALASTLTEAIQGVPHDRLFVLTDRTTLRLCWPLVKDIPAMNAAKMITIEPTDDNKTLSSLTHVWEQLQALGATRASLMVNLGGGMVTDLGGFAASTFKRGMAYINVPTTLLSMVDASVGGKTGINFGGLKNEIGVFAVPRVVVIDGQFLATLSRENLLSGYAEMLKHGLIADASHWRELMAFDIEQPDLHLLTDLVATSVAVKERIVEADPTERGLRKALNLGHTAGHAVESLAMATGHTLLHGYAVAFGLIPELYLSHCLAGFPQERLRQAVDFIRAHYGAFPFGCAHYARLIDLMRHDKKNTAGRINFTLLADIGQLRLDQTPTEAEIEEALDFASTTA